MEKILTKSDYRQLRLLSLLFFKNEVVAKNDAAEYLEISNLTLNKDITAINSFFSADVLKIQTYKRKWIFLSRNNQTNFALITATMIYTSQAYRIALSTLNQDEETPVSLANKEFISKSLAYNKLEELDNLLAENRLILNKTPIEILGNELSIRFFYFHIFDRSYPRSGWPFPEISLDSIYTYIYKIERFMGINLSPIAKVDYAIAISVHLKRIQNDHPLNLTEKQLLYWQQIINFYEIEKMDFTDLETILSQEIMVNEKSIIFLSLFLCSFTYSKKEALDKILNYYKTFRPMRYKAAEVLAELSNVDEKDSKFLTATLLVFFGKYTFIGKTAYILEIEEHENNNKINRIDKQKIEQKLLEVSAYAGDLEFIRDNMKAILPYVHELLNIASWLSQEHEKLHVKVISKNGYMWEELLKYQIRQHFSEEYLIFSNNDNGLGDIDCDLIITDFPILEKTAVEILTWNSPPTDLDFEMLRKFIKL
ncbi:mga helix-turn-helix domain-containing protein [Listeria weihenstephanensis FSL R9-0317]|uniref:Mga helix-turn-helix domain-containing protein n=1 Tax=Listeria weihenstephanensis TaxID=1006155 RepID=A0A1S7FXD5_9LIST|nr:helix-turn-helix domain-containing protein [Listeria weihenstephanensis]AQY52007.1 hypothetical protein UE46_13880 [Listeria weihenstephanensis]EUJ40200.1 mga helix-turn-helix domain-containing protein [Listeria weihenstephanensis FSL R9-0317]